MESSQASSIESVKTRLCEEIHSTIELANNIENSEMIEIVKLLLNMGREISGDIKKMNHSGIIQLLKELAHELKSMKFALTDNRKK